ncbi:MAG TPA: PRC-barrel domain-containing protein [Alphaproteobacteria bacterium]
MFSIDDVRGASIRAEDGTIGTVDDVYFDDARWIIRYLVVDTGGWLSGRKVLIAPAALDRPDLLNREFPVTLTKAQVAGSPDIATDKPVSRQQEERLHAHYGWSPYWGQGLIPGVPPTPFRQGPAYSGTADPLSMPGAGDVRAGGTSHDDTGGDPHLRSARAVTGHYIKAADGNIGHVEDFLADEDTWVVRYMIVDTRNWLPGKKVLVSPQWIEDISWADHTVRIDLTRAQVKAAPAYDPARPVDRAYEDRLFSFYGRVPYW